jgi:hypothetical protein
VIVETGLGDFRKGQVFRQIGAVRVSRAFRMYLLGTYLNSFSSSITCTPFSKFAVPFWPIEAKWPLTAIDSGGAVIALLIFDGLLPFVLEDTGDKEGEGFGAAMMTSLRILV